ncbi:MAG TPA: hypothetical protein PLN24_09370, partial [Victivallales bacterium]|nr:hypothetical protein [Victivallales bacterium]
MTEKIAGFVDLQVNGLKGVDFSSEKLTRDAVVFLCEELRRNKTIAFLATIITCPHKLLLRNIELISSAFKYEIVRKTLLGFHLEGPFISKVDGARGAHNPDYVSENRISWLNEVVKSSQGKIKIITVSAEQKGICRFIKAARRMNIIISLGHQMADRKDIQSAVEAGANLLTHFGNGLPKLIDRFENPLWPSLAEERLKTMIIPDGHHIPSDLIKVVFRVKGINNVIAVSDASSMALMPPGDYYSMGNKIRIERSGKLFNPDTGYLVGSGATL